MGSSVPGIWVSSPVPGSSVPEPRVWAPVPGRFIPGPQSLEIGHLKKAKSKVDTEYASEEN
ncbi:hypothetical protein E2562_033361 [Oryza meyeriana var. granulata]|uniref:Uncharacterized protein n=1 Tax=Oryza meyeriana var. granulata TaxID=110450 RepID=A0A6G1E6D2_9ORYZ|nr:hypothetical protein E2562_033361 [Oryza meyeriana var. granulata]